MPNPTIDNRGTIAGPGMHVLLVGISEYPHLPDPANPPTPNTWNFKRLASPALSAFRVYEWLIANEEFLRLPLKTVRMLLSPSALELAAAPGMAALGAPLATRAEFGAAVAQWRKDASDHSDNVTMLYYGGHGLQRGPGESILAFQDFGEPMVPKLNNCVRVSNIRAGMAPSAEFPTIAMTQFYFFDACRVVPDGIEKFDELAIPDVFEVLLNFADHRNAPTYFATVDGALAVARRGQMTAFCEALLDGLRRGAYQPKDVGGRVVWPISAAALKDAIESYFSRRKIAQEIRLDGHGRDPELLYLKSPPEVEFDVEFVPERVAGGGEFQLWDEGDQTKLHKVPIPQSPIFITQSAGNYRVVVDSDQLLARYRSSIMWVTQRMTAPWRHDLTASLKP